MRLDHIIVSVYLFSQMCYLLLFSLLFTFLVKIKNEFSEVSLCARRLNTYQALLIMPGGHSGEAIPVPIPNTEVKLSYADDTALEWESR